MSHLISLTVEQARYHVLILFKLDLSASYARGAPFWFAFVQNLKISTAGGVHSSLSAASAMRNHETAKISVRIYANLLVLRL